MNDTLVHEIVTRFHAGASVRRIALSLHIGRDAVRRVLQQIEHARSTGMPQGLSRPIPGRGSQLDAYETMIADLLSRYPDITAQRIYEELRRLGYEGGYTIVSKRVRVLRPRPVVQPVRRFETAPGEQAQMDYSTYDLDFTVEGRRRIHAFSYMLGYSRRQYVHFVEFQDFATTVREHIRAFEHLGGAAATCLYDNMKVVVSGYDGDQPVYNARFLGFSAHYGFRPIACRPRRPQTKGKVERPFGYVESNLLGGRTFLSLEHLNETTKWWLAEVADVHVHRQTKARPVDRHKEEQPHLLPLPARPYDASTVDYRTVDAEGFVVYRQNFYAAPWRLIGQTVAVRVTENEFTIYDRSFLAVASHQLFPRTVTGGRSGCPDHEPPRDSELRQQQLAERFAEFGTVGTQFLEGLLGRTRYGKNQAERILSMVAAYPRGDVTAALERATRYGERFRCLPLDASWRHGAGPRHRWICWLTITALTWTPSSKGNRRRHDPLPTIKPCWARNPTMPNRSNARSRPTPKTRNKTAKIATPHRLHDDIALALQTLGVVLAPGAFDVVLSEAERESLGHLEFLHRLLAGPAEAKRQRALERRIRAAGFRELTTLEGFDWEFNANGVDRRSIEQLATCDFVRRHENVILVGQTSLGKTRILQSVGQAACVLGYRVRYATSAKLLQEFSAALADGSFAGMLKEYARFDLLLIDEFGFDRLEREAQSQASTFYYRLLDARTGRRSTALATNIDFSAWANYLGDPPLATAFLDRLVDGALIQKLTGRSYRAHRARPTTEAGQVNQS